MELRIGIVDDQEVFVSELSHRIENLFWNRFPQHSITISVVKSISELHPKANKIWPWDVLFLDICLEDRFDGKSGLEIASKLRAKGFEGYIIFVSTYQEYSLDGYQSQAFRYLLKPIETEKLHATFLDLMNDYNKSIWTYTHEFLTKRVRLSSVYYFTVNNHQSEIHFAHGYDPLWMPLKKINESLPSQFIMCHRSFIINMDHVSNIIDKEVYLDNGERIPISRAYYDVVESFFIDI